MGIAFLTNVAFLGNLAGPDMILILLVILLLFGAKKLPDRRGMDQAVREFWKAKDEVEHETMRHPTAQPPHLATPAFISRLAGAFLILVSLILLLFWLKNGL
jgi:sec-independent protein translocase protein TatA